MLSFINTNNNKIFGTTGNGIVNLHQPLNDWVGI